MANPRRVYLVGVSLVGLVALKLIEQHPRQFSGALLISGVLGGTQFEADYVSHLRVLFEVFYPNVLPGSLLNPPTTFDLNADVIGPALAAIQANPAGVGALAGIEQLRLPFENPTELVSSVLSGLGFYYTAIGDILARTNGQSFFDNRDVVYSGPLPAEVLQLVNAQVARYQAKPHARNILRRNYEPTGSLQVPVLTLHTSRDPVVPVLHEDLYRAKVEAAGAQALLRQRVINRYGHFTETTAEMLDAFHELTQWARPRTITAPSIAEIEDETGCVSSR